MKILKGPYRGINLATPDAPHVRPTVDHFKKHILKISDAIKPNVVWDLFAGCGGVGIELLSQGCGEVIFVEQLKASTACIRLNLSECQMKSPTDFAKQKTLVIQQAVENFLKNPEEYGATNKPDLIFMDPPYNAGFVSATLKRLNSCAFIKPKTLCLVEHVAEETLPEDSIIKQQDVYGPKVLSLIELMPSN